MDHRIIHQILLTYLCFIPLLTFHEFGHAWMAWKCGDDTAKSLGRVTLNPIKHMELIGTVILPLLGLYLGATGSAAAGFIIGWGKPVPVNYAKLRHPRRDDNLVAMAGPAMNVILAVALVAIIKVLHLSGIRSADSKLELATMLSLFLCFFNLLPIPPLDGSHVLRNAIGMSMATYFQLCRWGFVMVIIALQIPVIRKSVIVAAVATYDLLQTLFGL